MRPRDARAITGALPPHRHRGAGMVLKLEVISMMSDVTKGARR